MARPLPHTHLYAACRRRSCRLRARGELRCIGLGAPTHRSRGSGTSNRRSRFRRRPCRGLSSSSSSSQQGAVAPGCTAWLSAGPQRATAGIARCAQCPAARGLHLQVGRQGSRVQGRSTAPQTATAPSMCCRSMPALCSLMSSSSSQSVAASKLLLNFHRRPWIPLSSCCRGRSSPCSWNVF